MGLSEAVKKALIDDNGILTLEQMNKALANIYAHSTILDFLQNEKKLISFDGVNIILLKFPIQQLVKIWEKYIHRNNVHPYEVFYLGAFYLFLKRRFPSKRAIDIINCNEDSVFLKSLGVDVNELALISNKVSRHFDDEMALYFENGYIEKLDYKSFYSFSKELYEYFINYNESRSLFSTPDTLVNLICRLVPNKQPLKVYNPAAGMLKLLTALKLNSSGDFFAEASEINKDIHTIGRLFALSNGFDVSFQQNNSLYDLERLEASYDLIVSVPPFSSKVDPNNWSKLGYKDLALNIISGSLAKLGDKGMAVFLVPDSVLFGNSNDFRRFRHEVIDSKLIHTVISLPHQLFYPITSVKSSLLIFRKGISHQKVQLIDASSKSFYSIDRDKNISLNVDTIVELFERRETSNLLQEDQSIYGVPKHVELEFRQLKDEDYSLNLNNYLSKYVIPQDSEFVVLGEFVSLLRLNQNKNERLPYLRVTDLNRGIIDNLEKFQLNKTKTKGKVLNEQAFLIGSIGSSSKPTWFKSNSPIELSSNIIALKPDESKVNCNYLLQELNSAYVQEQMEFLAVGSTSLKHLRVEDLLKIKIKLPSLTDQVIISQNRLEFVQQQALSVDNSNNTITDADIFKAISHEIGNILKGPEGFLDLLPDFLSSNKISLDKPIVESAVSKTVGEMILMAGKQIQNVYEVMQNMKGIIFSEKQYFKAEKTELKKFFKDKIKNEINQRNAEFFVGIGNNFIDPTSIFGAIDITQFQFVVRNIIANAFNHSGLGQDDGAALNLFVDIVSSDNELEIHFMNNGNPFPSDFSLDNYLEFNKRSGNSSGQGMGGYLIGRVVENHSGKIRIQSEKRIINVITKGETISLESNVDIVIAIPKTQ